MLSAANILQYRTVRILQICFWMCGQQLYLKYSISFRGNLFLANTNEETARISNLRSCYCGIQKVSVLINICEIYKLCCAIFVRSFQLFHNVKIFHNRLSAFLHRKRLNDFWLNLVSRTTHIKACWTNFIEVIMVVRMTMFLVVTSCELASRYQSSEKYCSIVRAEVLNKSSNLIVSYRYKN
jgi:hypothetical protein